MPGCRDLTEIGHIEAKRKTLVLPQELNVSVKACSADSMGIGETVVPSRCYKPSRSLGYVCSVTGSSYKLVTQQAKTFSIGYNIYL